jgi:hypothetical protein
MSSLKSLLTQAPRRWPFGLIRNTAHQRASGAVIQCAGDGASTYGLAIVEFDDQGLCFHRPQMQALRDVLATLKGQKPIILVFVHGWKHDGRSNDENLQQFMALLAHTAGKVDRPVLGVFGAWRGMTWYDGLGITENLTFWGRKEAALRVALGSVREMLGHLRDFRQGERDLAVLVIVGHSFGGLLVYAAVAQSLIEAAARWGSAPLPSFADLVLLVNPAFEAARYMPIQEQMSLRGARDDFDVGQKPVFISVTARNDWATGWAFPSGMAFSTIGESVRSWREREAVLRTMGHLGWMKTHDLAAPAAAPSARHQVQGIGHAGHHGNAVLTRAASSHPGNPFWVVQATKEVVDGHNCIWGQIFVDWVYDQVARHIPSANQNVPRPNCG